MSHATNQLTWCHWAETYRPICLTDPVSERSRETGAVGPTMPLEAVRGALFSVQRSTGCGAAPADATLHVRDYRCCDQAGSVSTGAGLPARGSSTFAATGIGSVRARPSSRPGKMRPPTRPGLAPALLPRGAGAGPASFRRPESVRMRPSSSGNDGTGRNHS